MYENRGPVAILWYQSGGSIFKFAEGGNHPLVNRVTEKGLIRQGMKEKYLNKIDKMEDMA